MLTYDHLFKVAKYQWQQALMMEYANYISYVLTPFSEILPWPSSTGITNLSELGKDLVKYLTMYFVRGPMDSGCMCVRMLWVQFEELQDTEYSNQIVLDYEMEDAISKVNVVASCLFYHFNTLENVIDCEDVQE